MRSSGREGKEGVVGRPPAVELLPLWWGWPGRRGCLLPAGMSAAAELARPDAADSFLHLTQRGGADGRGPAEAAVAAEVVFRHGPPPQREGGRGRSKSVSVSDGVVAVVLSGSPLGLLQVLRVLVSAPYWCGVPSPSWVVSDVQKNDQKSKP